MRLVIFVLIVCSLRIDRDLTYTFIDIFMCRTGDANFYKSKTTHSQQHSLAQYRNELSIKVVTSSRREVSKEDPINAPTISFYRRIEAGHIALRHRSS
ncbi:unnamed protein product [Albugo candida]|uniref:Secreted protein n=1 Tax=Albugo candida TaxID=65357 RepID=A0A024FTB9_9STRA|nr:unnamed protein product [Albugo candida]|eukprot:CCI10345.1 unnamed protein product [Albugo candida]